jgi:catechol 2,3-dioxygenase-like lactoylglutathione lyase family enzyme
VINELNHVGLVIRDLQKSLDFYEGILGARVVYSGFIPPSKTEVRYLQIGGGMIELLAPQEPASDTVFGITHVAFMSDDLDADHKAVVGMGYKELVAPKTAGSGVGRLSFVSDPNGARVELIERDLKMRLPQEEHPVVKDFDHYSLIANDLDGAMSFYRDAMGLKVLKEMEVPARQLSMVYLNHGYDVLELLHRPEPNNTDPMFGHFALRTDDCAKALEYCDDKGVPAEPGTPKMAGTGIGQIGLIRDPDDVKIEFVDRVDLRDL